MHCLQPNNCTADTKRWTLLVCSLQPLWCSAPSWDWVTIRLISSSASRQHQHWELKQKRRVFRGGGILSGVKWVRIRLGSYLLKTNSWPQNCPSQVKIILLLLPAAGVPLGHPGKSLQIRPKTVGNGKNHSKRDHLCLTKCIFTLSHFLRHVLHWLFRLYSYSVLLSVSTIHREVPILLSEHQLSFVLCNIYNKVINGRFVWFH